MAGSSVSSIKIGVGGWERITGVIGVESISVSMSVAGSALFPSGGGGCCEVEDVDHLFLRLLRFAYVQGAGLGDLGSPGDEVEDSGVFFILGLLEGDLGFVL